MKPPTCIVSLLALTATAVTSSPAAASAQTAASLPAPFVAQTISTTQGLATPSIGNGTIAWAVRDNPADTRGKGTTIWTLRDGKPAIAARLPALRAYRLEAGTYASGQPVVIVSEFRPQAPPTPFHLVRLDTGEARRLALGPHARLVSDVAIDAGRVLYSTSVRAGTFRGRSSLWTAQLNGRALTRPTRLRRSRPGETFETVRADRGRIAVTGYRRLPADDHRAALPLYAGTARGVWRKVGNGGGSDGGVFDVEAAGFSRDRQSVIVTTSSPEQVDFPVKRVWLRSGRTRPVKLLNNAAPTAPIEVSASYDPISRRLLLSSIAPEGSPQLGWSSVFG